MPHIHIITSSFIRRWRIVVFSKEARGAKGKAHCLDVKLISCRLWVALRAHSFCRFSEAAAQALATDQIRQRWEHTPKRETSSPLSCKSRIVLLKFGNAAARLYAIKKFEPPQSHLPSHQPQLKLNPGRSGPSPTCPLFFLSGTFWHCPAVQHLPGMPDIAGQASGMPFFARHCRTFAPAAARVCRTMPDIAGKCLTARPAAGHCAT